MEVIKSYTDIEQSKKLAEILPIKSADMYFEKGIRDNYKEAFGNYADMWIAENMLGIKTIPCWSLAALLSILRGTNISTPDTLNKIRYSCWNDYDIVYADNPVDACYEMILKLHEKDLL